MYSSQTQQWYLFHGETFSALRTSVELRSASGHRLQWCTVIGCLSIAATFKRAGTGPAFYEWDGISSCVFAFCSSRKGWNDGFMTNWATGRDESTG